MKAKLLIFSFIVSFVTSCAPAYIPNVINAPLLNNKKETQISVHTGTSGFDGQTAIAISKNIGVIGNFSYKNTADTAKHHKHLFFEGGLGYYTISKSNAHFEIFGGFGYGTLDIKGSYTIANTTQNYQTIAQQYRFFIQPDFGFSSQIFDLAFAPRVVYVQVKPEQFQYSTISRVFFEPAVILNIGFKNIFITSQAGISVPLSKVDANNWFNYQPFIFSIGLKFKIWKIYDTTPTY